MWLCGLRSADVSVSGLARVRATLRTRCVPFYEAATEAEAQCAVLNKAGRASPLYYIHAHARARRTHRAHTCTRADTHPRTRHGHRTQRPLTRTIHYAPHLAQPRHGAAG